MNPGAPDVYRDGLDSDCDGSDKVQMRLSEAFADLDDWDTSLQASPPEGSVANNGDVVIMDPHFDSGAGVLVDSWIALSTPMDWPRGEAWATLRLPNLTNATCELSVTGDSSMNVEFTTTGIHTVDLSPVGVAPFTITDLEIRCTGVGVASVDFLTLATADYIWPPAADLASAASLSDWVETNTPMGGATNNVVFYDGQDLYAASDVGGAAWTDDGEVWNVMNDLANGSTYNHLWPSQDLAIWDLAVMGWGKAWALTGDKIALSIDGSGNTTVDAGGLWSTTDGGSTWTREFGAEDGIAAYGRIWDCDPEVPARAGGHLMAISEHDVGIDGEGNPITFETLYVGSHATTGPGVYVVDDIGGACALPLTGAPDAPVSSLVLADGVDAWTADLLIGFKADQTEVGLMRCEVPGRLESPADCSDLSMITCEVVSGSTGIDVRDIEVDPLDSMVAYVADGGRRSDGSACAFDDPRAMEWTRSFSAGSWSDVLDEPDTLGVQGDKLETELVGLAISPVVGSECYLFGMFPGGQHRSYGDNSFPSLMRTSVAGGTWSWLDLENEDVTSGDDTNKQERWPNIEAGLDTSSAWADRDHWIDDQVARPLWAPAYAVDGLFVDIAPTGFSCAHTGGNECLVIADGFGLWFVDGWYKPDGTDFDSALKFRHAVPDDFQLTVATDVSVLANAAGSDMVWGTAKDIGATLAGEVRRGEVPCQFADWAGPGAAVDTVWGDDLDDAHVWVALGNGEDLLDTTQAIFHSSDGGANWCWTGTGSASFLTTSSAADCQDWETWTGDSAPANDPVVVWPTCDGGAGTGFSVASGLGLSRPTDIEALDSDGDVLVAAFKTPGEAGGTQGLIFTLDGGASWSKVLGFSMSFDKGSTTQTCTEQDFFSTDVHVAIRQAHTLEDGSTGGSALFADGSYQVGVVINGSSRDTSSDACGLMIARWDSTNDAGTPGSGATWEQVFLRGQKVTGDIAGNASGTQWPQNGTCTFDELGPTDVAFDPEDPDALIVASKLQAINGSAAGGVCLVDWEPASGNTYRDRTLVVDPSAVPITVTRVLPHPDLQSTYLLATRLERNELVECETLFGSGSPPLFGCARPTPRVVSLDTTTGVWETSTFVSSGLPNGNFNDLAWGGDERPIPGLEPMDKTCFSDLYAATNGSGIYQWTKWWQVGSNPCD